jgi:hypothetical protein
MAGRLFKGRRIFFSMDLEFGALASSAQLRNPAPARCTVLYAIDAVRDCDHVFWLSVQKMRQGRAVSAEYTFCANSLMEHTRRSKSLQ